MLNLRISAAPRIAPALACAAILLVTISSPASSFGHPIFEDRFEDGTFRDCDICPTMVLIPAGSFVQGSPMDEPGIDPWEMPQREVAVPAFAMAQTTVTFEQWDACVADAGCSYVPSDNGRGRESMPVVNVSWHDAQQYVAWLSQKTNHQYRLPTESEWEYATRAGSNTRFNTGDCITGEDANFNAANPAPGCPAGANVVPSGPAPVGSFPPNAFGLHDTHGNVREWTRDCWNAGYSGAPIDGSAWTSSGNCDRAVWRGGTWLSGGREIRSGYRTAAAASDVRNGSSGFRVALSVAP